MATRIVIIGGGPAGYEAALVAAGRGRDVAQVTVVDSDGIGGACVLFDCVPSKTFIASTGVRTELRRAQRPRLTTSTSRTPRSRCRRSTTACKTLAAVAVRRHRQPAAAAQGVTVDRAAAASSSTTVAGHGAAPRQGHRRPTATVGVLKADVVLIATGASPRVLPDAVPDGERILNWRQLYDLTELPEHLVVVGSGVTGAEFCNAYTELGVTVTVVGQPRPDPARTRTPTPPPCSRRCSPSAA